MNCSAELALTFPDPGEAEAARAALAPDNGDYLHAVVEGRTLHLRATASSPMQLLRTLDDALACLRALPFAPIGPNGDGPE